MERIKIGDVFKINTPIGEAYVQYVYEGETIGKLVIILPWVYENPQETLKKSSRAKERILYISLSEQKKDGRILSSFQIIRSLQVLRSLRNLEYR